MKLHNFFTGVVLMLCAASAQAEWDAIQCGPTTTPVLTSAGWQCQAARQGEPRVVYPNDEGARELRPFIASDVYWDAYPCDSCNSCRSSFSSCSSCSDCYSSCGAGCDTCSWSGRNYGYYW